MYRTKRLNDQKTNRPTFIMAVEPERPAAMTDRPLTNRLAEAISPYLLQHADQPVDWQPWDRHALAAARALDRPILLSIGYSACHWCHVMAHESFNNEAIAERLNAYFVNIKVDREERPDLDRIYQLAHQLLNGQGGGWPLTVFLDPLSQAPFFTGTYFPPEARHGMIGFGELAERIHRVWTSRRGELRDQHRQVHEALQAIARPAPGGSGDLAAAREALLAEAGARFDPENGGFGSGPKFPQGPLLAALLDLGGESAAQMLGDTLDAIARLGLHDHLGGGFFRYCVDPVWEIPHFEKMLSDNALLLSLYARAAQRWKRDDFTAVCERLVEWLERDMLLANGGFATSLDADSENGEGAFYVWKPQQVSGHLSGTDYALFAARFGLDGPANFEHNRWHLLIARSSAELVEPGLDRAQVVRRLAEGRRTLLAARQQRPAPGRDDKMLAAWNGLAIESLAEAGRLLNRPDWLERAGEAFQAVAINLFGQEPPRAVWRAGRSAQSALLDDHAAMLLAALELLRWRFEMAWFNLARRIGRRIVEQFADPLGGGLYLTPHDHETLLTRPLAHADDATPSGAGQAVLGLARLGQLCGDPALLEAAQRAIQAASGDIERSAIGHASLLRAWQALEEPGAQIVLAGPDEVTRLWQQELAVEPGCRVYRLPPGLDIDQLPDALAALATSPTAIGQLCQGQHCLLPAQRLEELRAQLAESVH